MGQGGTAHVAGSRHCRARLPCLASPGLTPSSKGPTAPACTAYVAAMARTHSSRSAEGSEGSPRAAVPARPRLGPAAPGPGPAAGWLLLAVAVTVLPSGPPGG